MRNQTHVSDLLRNGPGITSRSSRNQDQTKLWQGLLTLPLGRPKVSNPKPGGRPTVQQTAGSGDPRQPPT